jgi:hypothetical protein
MDRDVPAFVWTVIVITVLMWLVGGFAWHPAVILAVYAVGAVAGAILADEIVARFDTLADERRYRRYNAGRQWHHRMTATAAGTADDKPTEPATAGTDEGDDQ